MRQMLFCLLVVVSAVACGCTCRTVVDDVDWPNRAAQVKVGMTRDEVEKLLPPIADSPRPALAGGGSETIHYWIETNLAVRLTFGTNPSHTNSFGRLLFKPVLSQQTMPGSKTKIKD